MSVISAVGHHRAGTVARRRSRALGAVFVLVLMLATTAGCVGGIGDAGDTKPLDGPVPATPSAVSGPAIRGTVIDSHGHLGAGATVTLTKALRPSERLWRDAKAWATLGLACFDKQGCTAPSVRAVVAANGQFALPVPHGITKRDGLALTVEATRGAHARVETTLLLPATATAGRTIKTVPLAGDPAVLARHGTRATLRLPAVSGGSGHATVQMSPLADSADESAGAPAKTDVSHGFDTRDVEDGRAMLVGRQTGAAHGLAALYSASLAITGHDIPASRGASCVIEGSRGQGLPQHPCGLTNGNLDDGWQPHDDPACVNGPCPGTAQADHRDVTVTLDHPLNATLLVVRGCGFTCKVQISTDGRTFAAPHGPAVDDTSTVYIRKLTATHVTAVRVQTATGGFFDSLRQVSVFS